MLLVFLMTVYTTQATSILTSKYMKLETGQINGEIGSVTTVKSKLQCSDRYEVLVADLAPQGGVNLLFAQYFPENWTKMKGIRPREGCTSLILPWIC